MDSTKTHQQCAKSYTHTQLGKTSQHWSGQNWTSWATYYGHGYWCSTYAATKLYLSDNECQQTEKDHQYQSDSEKIARSPKNLYVPTLHMQCNGYSTIR